MQLVTFAASSGSGVRCDGMGWGGMGRDGVGWDEMGRTGWDGMGWGGMGWEGMGWDGIGWDGMECHHLCQQHRTLIAATQVQLLAPTGHEALLAKILNLWRSTECEYVACARRKDYVTHSGAG